MSHFHSDQKLRVKIPLLREIFLQKTITESEWMTFISKGRGRENDIKYLVFGHWNLFVAAAAVSQNVRGDSFCRCRPPWETDRLHKKKKKNQSRHRKKFDFWKKKKLKRTASLRIQITALLSDLLNKNFLVFFFFKNERNGFWNSVCNLF